jgi:predicted outer membrane repeat protein
LDTHGRSRISSILTNLFFLMGIFLIVLPCAAQEQLSGAQSGILPGGLYDVVDDISVEQMTTWTLDPGAELRFQEGTALHVRGALFSYGSEADSVRFSRFSDDEPWGGIRIQGGAYARFIHSVVTGSNQTAIHGYNNGLMYVYGSRISQNTDINSEYAGIYSESALLDTIWNSTFSDNDGIGFYWYGHDADIRNCVFSGNTGSSIRASYAHGSIKNTQFINNSDSGFVNHSSGIEIDSCVFSYNSAQEGAAILDYHGHTDISRCVFLSNSSFTNGGAIMSHAEDDQLYFNNCIFDSNGSQQQGSAIFAPHPVLVNCIIINHVTNEAIYSESSGGPVYNNLFHNNLLNYNTEQNEPPDLFGEIVTTNVNGDSCDFYSNLFVDPQFDQIQDPYYLLSTSPAIDAGHFAIQNDPDFTLPDIGIHYFDQTASVAEQLQISVPRTFSIFNAYPNPFNSSITIDFALAAPSVVDYSVYTVSGREVDAGTWGWITGAQTRSWRAPRTLASGVYLVRFSGNDQTATRRITYLK